MPVPFNLADFKRLKRLFELAPRGGRVQLSIYIDPSPGEGQPVNTCYVSLEMKGYLPADLVKELLET